MSDSFQTRSTLEVNGKSYTYYSLEKLGQQFDISHLPFATRILLENQLRREDGVTATKASIEAVAKWDPEAKPDTEIAFMPARVVLQDFTGVPCVVDLAAMRDAVVKLGGSPDNINPQIPSELVIDHSVQVDVYGKANALDLNSKIEFERNKERYSFLRWGQKAFKNFKVVPPSTGIVHQVNIEYLARVAMTNDEGLVYPDTVFGTDSHTTMVNGLGVLGWGVGGIEAEAAMLGQPSSMLIPQVVGFELSGKMPEGATATDLVLTVTQKLREHGVVGKFVEFFGPGLDHLPVADRSTLANMAPEYGATCGIFPVDEATLSYLRLTGREADEIALVEAYAKAQGLWRDQEAAKKVRYSSVVKLDMGEVLPSLAGPKRPQDRVLLSDMPTGFDAAAKTISGNDSRVSPVANVSMDGHDFELKDGAVVIAAITSCTNTSNPYVMVAAGLLARNAAKRGLNVKPWVKTSLAPGSQVVTDYLNKANLTDDLEKLGFYTVGYGCTTCIGNSGPLPEAIDKAIAEHDLIVGSVLSGNRNFEGRIHQLIKTNWLASPPLVVAYAIAGSLNINLSTEPLAQDADGNDVYLKDIWPSTQEIQDTVHQTIDSDMFESRYSNVFAGDSRWNAVQSPEGQSYEWDEASTYIKNPPFFDGMTMDVSPIEDIQGARCLGLFGESITTDHISPAGTIGAESPAGKFLRGRGVEPVNFNSFGSRRGNDDVMTRGTFGNIRIKNKMLGGKEGGYTLHFPEKTEMTIFDASVKYREAGTPLIVMAGTQYGTGSSRDWAAKGTILLGVKAVIAQSYERIHRSNLVGMGVVPLQFKAGENADSLGLDGSELFSITGLQDGEAKTASVKAVHENGKETSFEVDVMLLTPKEIEYCRHGGILHYVLRQLAA